MGKRLRKVKDLGHPPQSPHEIAASTSQQVDDDEVEDEVEETAVDEGTAQLEATMQVVPYVVRLEVSLAEPSNGEDKMYMDMGEDILTKTRMYSCYDCPPIPLCRLIPYAKVRGLRDDVSDLKIAFVREGYVPEKGAFIVSIWTRDKAVSIVDEAFKREWDPLWHEINEEFEAELMQKEHLQGLAGHMFYVWEGNHRTVAWLSSIKECFKETKVKHCRVLCTIIDPSKVSEIALLTSLQRMN